jgi:hypothetical protein
MHRHAATDDDEKVSVLIAVHHDPRRCAQHGMKPHGRTKDARMHSTENNSVEISPHHRAPMSLPAPVFEEAELAAAPAVCAQLYTPHASSSFADAGRVWQALLRKLADRFTDVFVVTTDSVFAAGVDSGVVTSNLESGLAAFDRTLTNSWFRNDADGDARRFLLIVHWDDETQLWKQARMRRFLRNHSSLQLSVWFSSKLAVSGRRQPRGLIQVPTELLSKSHAAALQSTSAEANVWQTEAAIPFWICSPAALGSLESNHTRAWTEALRTDAPPASSEERSFYVRAGRRWVQLRPGLVADERDGGAPASNDLTDERKALEMQRELASQQRRASGILAVLDHVEHQHEPTSPQSSEQQRGCSCAVCLQELTFRPGSAAMQPMVLGCGHIVCLGCLRGHIQRCSDTIDDKMQDLCVPEVASQLLARHDPLACMLLACPQCQQSVRVVIKPRT